VWSLGNYDKNFIKMVDPDFINYLKTNMDINAACTLAKYGEKEGGPYLLQTLPHYAHDQYEGTICSWAIEGLKDKELIPQIKELLKSDDANLRYNAAFILAFWDDNSGQEILKTALDDKTIKSRLHSAVTLALGNLGDKTVIPQLVKELQSDVPSARLTAIDLLGKMDDKSVIPDLINTLKDGLPKVRTKALKTLEQLTQLRLDFYPDDTDENRSNQIKKLMDWWRDNKSKFVESK
jgi:hypothetical protein